MSLLKKKKRSKGVKQGERERKGPNPRPRGSMVVCNVAWQGDSSALPFTSSFFIALRRHAVRNINYCTYQDCSQSQTRQLSHYCTPFVKISTPHNHHFLPDFRRRSFTAILLLGGRICEIRTTASTPSPSPNTRHTRVSRPLQTK